MGYSIVIDISVARAAGMSGKPLPEACRRILEIMRDQDFNLAVSKPVIDEWMKIEPGTDGQPRLYASLLALQWLKDMQSSGRVIPITVIENSSLRTKCLNGLQQDARISSSYPPVAKDFHLIETALQSDNRVISLDEKMFKHLKNLEEIANEVCAVMWVSPLGTKAETWLVSGAPEDPAFFICNRHGT